MIICNERVDQHQVRPTDVLYSKPDAVRKLAVAMLINIAESNIDMVCDMDDDFLTKDSIESAFKNLNDVVLSVLEDHIFDLRNELTKMLLDIKVDARVRKMEFNDIGRLSDVDVELTFRQP